MTRKVYKTAQGKMVDLGALQLRNENIRAVGNMGVNARGDLLDSNNRTIQSRNDQVARQYRRQTTNVTDEQVVSPGKSPAPAKEPSAKRAKQEPEAQPAAITDAASTPQPTKPVTGLAAAIAKARQIKQEELKSPRQVAAHQQSKTQ